MKIHQNGQNWVIEDKLDINLIDQISDIINNNISELVPYKKNKSTQGDAEQYHFKCLQFEFKNLNFIKFCSDYEKTIINILNNSKILKKDFISNISLKLNGSWTVIGNKNSYHSPHYHNRGLDFGISTVLYLKVPDTNLEGDLSNKIFLILNSGVNNNFYKNDEKYVFINPEVGKILIFPDWIIHGTCPQTEGIRQTFNVDYEICSKFAKKSSSEVFEYK